MTKKYQGWFRGEDDTCDVECECGYAAYGSEERIFISGDSITRCPNCGRGYRVEFNVIQYEKDESDTKYREYAGKCYSDD